MPKKKKNPLLPKPLEIPPKYQSVWQRLVKAERALLTARSTLDMTIDYTIALRQAITNLIQQEKQEKYLAQKVLRKEEK